MTHPVMPQTEGCGFPEDRLVEVPLGDFIEYLEGRIAEMREGCQNPKCPNGHKIEIAIFKGGKFCSDNCRKAIGLDPKKEKI